MISGKEDEDYDDKAKNKNKKEQPTCDSGDDVAAAAAVAAATATKSNISNCMKGKIILITGSNRGIGKAFVDTFISYGVSKIYAGVRDIESAKKIVPLIIIKVMMTIIKTLLLLYLFILI
jgi:hypothetical protein